MPAILIVCTANICRSPMGEGILKQLLLNRVDADQWEVDSAGLYADYGHTPAGLSTLMMLRRGSDISSHRSQPITGDLIGRYDLVLTMEKYHKDKLRAKFHQHSRRIYMISEMAGTSEDISDPMGGELEDYEETAKLLEHIFSKSLDRIVELATNFQKMRLNQAESRA